MFILRCLYAESSLWKHVALFDHQLLCELRYPQCNIVLTILFVTETPYKSGSHEWYKLRTHPMNQKASEHSESGQGTRLERIWNGCLIVALGRHCEADSFITPPGTLSMHRKPNRLEGGPVFDWLTAMLRPVWTGSRFPSLPMMVMWLIMWTVGMPN